MSAILPIEQLIDFLKEIASAPRGDFLRLCHKIEALPRITMSEAGDCAVMLASAAKILARQLYHANAINEQEMRAMCRSICAVLQNELNAADEARRRPRRYYSDVG